MAMNINVVSLYNFYYLFNLKRVIDGAYVTYTKKYKSGFSFEYNSSIY